MEGTELHPVQRDRVWYFDPVEVAEYTSVHGTAPGSSDPGRVASAVFTLLGEGASFRDVVRRTCQPPDVVRALYRDWKTGFETERASDEDDADVIEALRTRDEEEVRRWEKEMRERQEREEEEARREGEQLAARRARRTRWSHFVRG
jgi:hypothetical protein